MKRVVLLSSIALAAAVASSVPASAQTVIVRHRPFAAPPVFVQRPPILIARPRRVFAAPVVVEEPPVVVARPRRMYAAPVVVEQPPVIIRQRRVRRTRVIVQPRPAYQYAPRYGYQQQSQVYGQQVGYGYQQAGYTYAQPSYGYQQTGYTYAQPGYATTYGSPYSSVVVQRPVNPVGAIVSGALGGLFGVGY